MALVKGSAFAVLPGLWVVQFQQLAEKCRVTVLHEGSVLAEGSIDHVTNDESVIDVYLGR